MYKQILYRISILVVFFTLAVTSCKKDVQGPAYDYFVSKELLSSYNQSQVNFLIDAVTAVVPEAADLKPLVKSDINIYRMVYNTKVNGQDIQASGLVCTPSAPGTYPVLSFQNGTNTEFAAAPSEAAFDPLYQLVEIISAMGYVVVFPDYPGFGESAGIVHPYLVAQPTVTSIVDMYRSVKELNDHGDFPGITIADDYYLMGYSQGGWSTLQLHKALELDYNSEFNLKGTFCGAGPYNLYLLLEDMVDSPTYPMPIYIAYIIYAYKAYNQFTNPVTDIIKEPYASRLPALFNGHNSSGQINAQLTSTISDLMNPAFLSGFATDPVYAPVRNALQANSITPWHTMVPLLMIHGEEDTSVDPSATENMYAAMLQQGTSTDIITKVMLPGADHGSGLAPAVIMGLLFLEDIKDGQ